MSKKFIEKLYLKIAIIILLTAISCTSKSTKEIPETASYEEDFITDFKIPDTGDYETFPVFKASDILEPEMLNSEDYSIVEEVNSDCVYLIYDIVTPYGEYHVEGDHMLKVRLNEIRAIEELKEISAAEAITTGLVETAILPFRAAIHVATNPVETVIGLPGGILSFFKRMYYAGESLVKVTVDVFTQDENNTETQVVESNEDDGKSSELETAVIIEDENQDLNNLIDWYFGISNGERELAKYLGVDPYTSNVVLAEELKRVGTYERVGKFGTSVLTAPIIPALGVIKNIDKHIWTKHPKELMEFNNNSLQEMDIKQEYIEAFLNSPYYSPTFQTTIVLGLRELEGVENREKLLKDSLAAISISDAQYFTSMLVLMVWYHNNVNQFERIAELAYVPSAITKDNKIIAMIPSDYICWSREVAEAAVINNHVLENLQVDGREYWFASKVSERTKQELTNLGWEVVVDETLRTIGIPGIEETKKEATEEINEGSLPAEIDVNPGVLFDKELHKQETETPNR